MNKPSNTKKNKLRAGTSFAVSVITVALVISGIQLYVMPHGRVAYWHSFTVWGLEKEQWESLHVAFALLFVASAILHFVLNWRAFAGYLRKRKRLLAASLLFGAVLVFGAAAIVPPFSYLMDGSEAIKKVWGKAPPPVPHYEMKSLAEISQEEEIPMEDIRRSLAAAGIPNASPEDTLKSLSHLTGNSPAQIYKFMGGKRKSPRTKK